MIPTEVLMDHYRRMSSHSVASVMFGTCAIILATVPFLGWFAALPLALIGLVLAFTGVREGLDWNFPIGMPIAGGALALGAIGVLAMMTILTAIWSGYVPAEHVVLHH